MEAVPLNNYRHYDYVYPEYVPEVYTEYPQCIVLKEEQVERPQYSQHFHEEQEYSTSDDEYEEGLKALPLPPKELQKIYAREGQKVRLSSAEFGSFPYVTDRFGHILPVALDDTFDEYCGQLEEDTEETPTYGDKASRGRKKKQLVAQINKSGSDEESPYQVPRSRDSPPAKLLHVVKDGEDEVNIFCI